MNSAVTALYALRHSFLQRTISLIGLSFKSHFRICLVFDLSALDANRSLPVGNRCRCETGIYIITFDKIKL